jgi:hypothetical protein
MSTDFDSAAEGSHGVLRMLSFVTPMGYSFGNAASMSIVFHCTDDSCCLISEGSHSVDQNGSHEDEDMVFSA